MKLNNKGFAISTVMYMILIMAVILITLTLSILSSRKLILDSGTKEARNNIYNVYDISYRQALEILKTEAIAYAEENNIEKDSIKIGDLNSSIDKEILDGYKLTEKYLTIISNGTSYAVYLGKSKIITDISKTVNNLIDIVDYKISGNSYQETYTGKNLFDINNFNNTRVTVDGNNVKVSVVSGNSSQSTGATLQELCPDIEVGKTYYLYYTSDASNTNFSIGSYAEANFWSSGSSRTITETDLTTVVRIGRGGGGTINLTNIQMTEEGTTVTEYEPYVGGKPSPNPEYPQEVQSVGEYDSTTGKYKIPVTVSGKNLINIPIVEERTLGGVTFSIDENGLIHLNGTVTETAVWSMSLGQTFNNPKFTTIIENGSVTGLNSTIYLKMGEGNYITNYFIDGNVHTTNGEVSFSNLYMTVRVGDVFDNFVFGVMLTENENVTEYEPYYQPATTNIYLDEPLRKVGTYEDKIDFTSSKLDRIINKTNVSNSSWSSSVDGTMIYYMLLDNRSAGDVKEVLSNMFVANAITTSNNNIGIGIYNTYILRVRPNLTTYPTLSDWTNFLSTNEMLVYYPLQTPPKEESIDLPKLDTGIGNYKIEIGTNIEPSSVEFTVIQKIKQI